MDIFKPWRKPKKEEPTQEKQSLFRTHPLGEKVKSFTMPTFDQPTNSATVASDGYIGEPLNPKFQQWGCNTAQLGFFASGATFVGYQTCAMMATNWLVDKACSMPARDAIRQGYKVTCGNEESQQELRDTDDRFNIMRNMSEMVNFGRVYGGRMVMFDIECENPTEFYGSPFNIDGVREGQYRGLSQIDPNWISPVLTDACLRDPTSQDFYQPTYWRVGDRKIHKSHLHIFVPYPVTDFMKPTYNYMGISVPQRIMERVYSAERSANEAPQLLMTKRLINLQVGDSALANKATLAANLEEWSELMNNYGIKVTGSGETVAQFDTSLADVDTVIMTQYQLVASGAHVPATKLLGTQPKGFNATGEYEESIYREELESVQTHDLSPLLRRHYELVAKSEGIDTGNITIQWQPLDSPTAKEWAEIEKIKADRDAVLFNAGALDAEDIRNRLIADKEGDFHNLEEATFTDGEANANEETANLGRTTGSGIF